MARFWVEDTGPGLSKDDLGHVFERFWKKCPRSHLGHGLGLSICKAIVELHDGEISAQSELGLGTRFSFTVPLHDPSTGGGHSGMRRRLARGSDRHG